MATGSSDFVGWRAVGLASKCAWEVVAVIRKETEAKLSNLVVSPINWAIDWSGAFDSVGCVAHCSVRVHKINECGQDIFIAYRDTNTLGTLNLAKQAVEAGVKRFVL